MSTLLASDAEILADVDGLLISALALVHFGPAEQGTAQAVDVACASEVLLFRLRLARRAVTELRQALNLPVRQFPHTARVSSVSAVSGGPGPNHLLAAGEELTPSSAVVAATAARGSLRDRPDTTPEAGANVPDGFSEGYQPGCTTGRAVGADGAATYAMPLSFAEGEDRLVGGIRPQDPPGQPQPQPPQPDPRPFPPPLTPHLSRSRP